MSDYSGLALVMGGGGARAAYQAGVLRYLARTLPELRFPILTGVSAGAINCMMLAHHPGTIHQTVEKLCSLWEGVTVDQVFESNFVSLTREVFKWGFRLLSGGSKLAPPTQGMVDTRPLREFLSGALECQECEIPGVQRNIDSGRLHAVAITTTNYATGQSITWVQGRYQELWVRPQRRAYSSRVTLDHLMASCALPFFFPAVRVGESWHGDGGIRLTTPLSPALHLGAERMFAISTRYMREQAEADSASISGYPPPAQVAGVLMNAIFLDMLDFDADNLERLNDLVREVPEEKRGRLRPVELFILRPSQDLGRLASAYEAKLPSAFRFLTRGLGSRETKSPDFLSMLMFQPDYVRRLLDLGEEDAEDRSDELLEFIRGRPLPKPQLIPQSY